MAAINQTNKEQSQTAQATNTSAPTHVAGIGASAGGIEALQTLFEHITFNEEIAYIVIQHLSPHFKSLMVEILSKHTLLKVEAIKEGMTIAANHVYVAPPGKNVSVFHGKLFTSEQDRSAGFLFPIDSFFESLAEDYQDKSIGIILSGTGSDGTHGGRMIKEVGGLLIAQDPASAKFSGMPRSVINTGLVDQILSPDNIPVMLTNYTSFPRTPAEQKLGDEEVGDNLERILNMLKKKFRIDFSNYKPTTVLRRIEHRMSVNLISTHEEYIATLQESERETDILFKELLIGVTRFFRDPESYEALKRQIIPKLFEVAETRPTNAIRVWVAGCSTGEEAYSLAILLQDYAHKFKQRYFDIKVFATDADMHAITVAGAGIYPPSITADVPEEYLDRYFVKEGENFRIIREIRQKVIFAPQDIINNAPFSRIDLATCRNVLIYFKPDIQSHVLKKIAYSLAPSGYLFLGSSENLGEVSKLFTNLNPTHKLFKYQASSRPQIVPSFPSGPSIYAQKLPKNKTEEPIKPQRSRSNTAFTNMLISTLGGYLPDSIIVDKNGEILYTFGDTSLYMAMPSGEVNMHLTSLVIPSLQTTLSTAIHQAHQTKEKVIYKDVAFVHSEEKITFDLIIQPHIRMEEVDCCLIIFHSGQKEPIKEGDVISNVDIDKQTLQRIQGLENKLDFTEETLQATIEELETSNEELQATNEELMAANEELQSTNEELHSTNEELVTVNNEYHTKIKEMSSLNDDMENILRCSEISTIFLDRELKIRRFSATSQQFVRLKDTDVGRPFSHFSHITGDINLLKQANRVLETHQQIDRELETENGKSFLVRVYPYISHIDQIEGVVITFVDITPLKDSARQLETAIHERSIAKEALKQTEEQLAKLVEARKSSIIYCRSLTGKKHLTYISSNVKDLFGYSSTQFLDNPSFWVDCIHPDDSPRALNYFEKHYPQAGATPLEFRFKCKDGTYKWLRDETKLIIDDERKSTESLGSWVDITLEKVKP